jgi:long-chain acyl-CoA synthetase
MNLIDLIEKNARLYPNELAYVEIRPVSKTHREITWIGFHERTNLLANAFLEKGIIEGSSVLLLGKNSLSWLENYFAILKTGAWVIPLNFRFTDEEIRFCTQVAEPIAFIFDEEYVPRIETLRDSIPSVKSLVCMGRTDSPHVEELETIIKTGSFRSPEISIDDQKPCALYFTSGTTGTPKPVHITHANLFSTAITECTNNRFNHEDSLLMMPPLYHLAIGHLLGLLPVGGKTVLLTERITPQYILEAVARDNISCLFLLVPWALDLLEALEKGRVIKEKYDLSAWRYTLMGAQPIPASIVKRLKIFFPNMQFDTSYGLSESAGPGVLHLGVQNEHKLGSLGKEARMWSTRIVFEGKDVETGQVGELIIKGNGVMTGYYKNHDLTDQTIVDGWLYTGDLVRRDEDGFIFLVDRKKDLVISGGENIYPVEIEQIILQHSKIYDVAVIGIPDERLGEIVAAVIQTVSGETLNEDEVIAFCENNMPRYKRPRSIIFDTVPRSPTGKIEKPKLRRKYADA